MREDIKAKTITFNMRDPMEKAMYDFSVEMKNNKHSFNRMVKNFILLYMVNTGNAPKGYQIQSGIGLSPSISSGKTKIKSERSYASKAVFSTED